MTGRRGASRTQRPSSPRSSPRWSDRFRAHQGGGTKPKFKKIKEGEDLVRQGQAGTEVFLILDGIFVVEIDGDEVAEIGPGAVVGERAHLNGTRTATPGACTPGRVASVPYDALDPEALGSLAAAHRREE